MQTAGFVNEEDVSLIVAKYDDILNASTSDLSVGNYVWVGEYKTSWDVIKYIRTVDRVIQITSDLEAETVTITLKEQARYEPNEIIGVLDVTGAEKFFKVKSVSLGNIICYANGTTEDVATADGFVTRFISARVATVAEANVRVLNSRLNTGELIWIDNDDQGRWVVLQNKPIYLSLIHI